MTPLNEIRAQHVNVVLHAPNVGMKEVAYHPVKDVDERVLGRTMGTHAMVRDFIVVSYCPEIKLCWALSGVKLRTCDPAACTEAKAGVYRRGCR